MTTTAHTFRRLASATGLAALLAALVIPVTAGAKPVPVDYPAPGTRGVAALDETLDPAIATAIRARQSSQATDLRSPDTRDAAAGSGTLDQAIATAMAAHQAAQASADRRSPDTLDTAAKVNAPLPTMSTGSSDGFDWGTFAIVVGALGAMFVFVGLGGSAVVATRRTRVKSGGSVPAA